MVAGMSSRFGGSPKQFAIVGNRETGETLIEYSVNQALKAAKNICSIDKIIFITNPNTEQGFKNIFNGRSWWDCDTVFEYIQQDFDQTKRSRPWGTCGAVCSLLGHVDQPFILLNGDDIYGIETFKTGYQMLLSEQNNIIGGCKIVDTMPEDGLVRFKGEMQPGITLRDLVNAIPYAAIQKGLLTVAKEGKKNVFSGRCLEIEGLPDMKVEQAFELSDASAERSASGCTVRLNKEPIIEYLKSNIVMLRWMIASGYGDAKTLERRAQAMEEWIENPELLEPDENAEYAEIIEIDLNEITEPLLACPNDPDDIKPLSEVANTEIQEVFIGSCMTNIGHFRAAETLLNKYNGTKARLWVVPPTKMDEKQLMEEGIYNVFGTSGARTELPGCSLCMGNQARVLANSTVVSTSTRNFPNRLGDGANVFLASAELAAISSVIGRLPTPDEYQKYMEDINPLSDEIYRYLNFNEIDTYVESANSADIPTINIVNPS